MPNTDRGFTTGDYVTASTPDDNWDGYTFKITGFGRNLLGQPVVRVVDIARPDGPGTTFYPHELTWEDGTRPTDPVTSLGRASDYPDAIRVNRGAM